MTGTGDISSRDGSGAPERATPSPNAAERHRTAIRRRCAEGGMHIDRVGRAWRIRGAGNYILCTDLVHVTLIDLQPDRVLSDRG